MIFKYDFIIAKLHGINSKSLIGERFDNLKKITAIDRLVKELGFSELEIEKGFSIYTLLEKSYKQKIFKQLNYIVNFFEGKNNFINSMLLKYEIDNVKLIINCYYSKQNKDPDFPKPTVLNIFDYQRIKEMDLTKIENIKEIFSNTIFNFILNMLDENKDHLFVENSIDKFYYYNLIDALETIKSYEFKKIKEILVLEMNWQNIIWAFRTAYFYKKNFKNVLESFLSHKWLIDGKKLEAIFNLNYSPGELENSLKKIVPPYYYNFILKFVNSTGELDLNSLEKAAIKEIITRYTHFFYLENFNILPIIAFIYLKQVEYDNIIKLTESLRYNLKLE